jgi:hypothetical protein
MNSKQITTSVGTITIKELTLGEDNDATREAIQYCELHIEKKFDGLLRKEFLILNSIVERDIIKDYETLRALNRKDGNAIIKVYNELNEVSSGE